jgi:hypothetical protein
MRQVIIEHIRLDPSGRLRVRPTPPQRSGPYYVYIYRDASGIAWDDLHSEFYVQENAEADPVNEFKRIAAAVAREYSEKLTLSASTECEGLPPQVIAELELVVNARLPPEPV